MPTDRDEATIERHGRSVRAAYRAARLTPSQYERHRARLGARYTEAPARPRSRLVTIAGVLAVTLLFIVTLLVWSSLIPEDDPDEQALATLPPTSAITPTSGVTPLPEATISPTTPPATVPVGSDDSSGYDRSTERCITTPFADTGPPDESQAAFTETWYGGDPDGLWAGLGRENDGIWSTGNRMLWWRLNPVPIEVRGHRLDAYAPPLDANLPDGYQGLSHHISILTFPMPGCWEIEASAGDEMHLRFVVEVVPYEETPQGIRVQQQLDAVAAEREDATPSPVPETCPASAWVGPQSRIYNQYPAALIGDEDWHYSYYLDGELLSLNTRLGLLFDGDNPVVWLSAAGNLPENAVMTASKLEDDGSTTTLDFEPPNYDSVVHDGSGGFLTVHAMTLTFPAAGCWTLAVTTDDVSFSHTVYVYPRVDHEKVLGRERMYIVEQDGSIWGRDLKSGQDLFQISAGIAVDVALSPDGTRLYFVNHESLIAIDALTGAELWRTPIEDRIRWLLGSGPSTVAVTQDGQRLLVYSSFAPERQWAQIFDARDGSKIGDTSTMSGNCPAEMRPSPDERTLYLVCIRFESLRFIDLESGETVDSIAGQFSGSAISPDGRLLYAVTTSKRLITIDMDSREVVSDIELELPASPSLLKQMVSVSPQGARLYVGLGREDNDDDSGSQDVHEIAIIDLASGSTVDVFETAYQIDGKGLAVGRDGAVYVNTSSQIVQLFPDEYDPVVIHDGVEIRQFLVSRLAD